MNEASNASKLDLMNARLAALKHIGQGIPAQERVALLTLSGKVTLEFTDDAAKLREMLMKNKATSQATTRTAPKQPSPAIS